MTESSAPEDTDVIDELNVVLDDRYASAIPLTSSIKLARLGIQVSLAAETLKANPSDAARDEYKKSLKTFLNFRAGLIQEAINENNISGASKDDMKIAGDPFLSPSEIVQINAGIVPTDEFGNKVKEQTNRASLGRRPKVISLDELKEVLKRAEANITLVEGVPSHWEPVMPYDHMFNSIELAKLIDGMEQLLLKQGFSPERARRYAEASIYSSHVTGTPDIRLRYKDTTGNYPGTFILGNSSSTSTFRAVTDNEIVAIMEAADSVGSKVSVPGTSEESTKHAPMFADGANVLITISGQEHAVHMAQRNPSGAAGYASRFTGVTMLVDVVRRAHDFVARGGVVDPDSADPDRRHSSIRLDSNTTIEQYLQYVFTHELGHTMHFGYINDNELNAGWTPPKRENGDWTPPAGTSFISNYGMTAPHEHFAESFAKYLITGVATPEFLELLRSKGMLKSQQKTDASKKPLVF